MRSLLACFLAACAILPAAAFAQTQDSVEATIAAARQAARDEHYTEAAALMRKAIDRAPERRDALLREYAEDLASSGDAHDAIPLYREALGSGALSPADSRLARLGLARALVDVKQTKAAETEYHLLLAADPNDVDARLDYAQLLWDGGDLGGARAQYAAVLSVEPNNDEAQTDFARLESWRQRYHESKRLSLAYLQQHQNDTQNRVTLAQDELWMGRPDEAAAVAATVLANDPGNSDAKSLLSQSRETGAPRLEVAFQSAKQSDDTLIQDTQFFAAASPDNGRTTIGASFEKSRYSATNADAQIYLERPALHLTRHFSDWTSFTGVISWDGISAPQDSTVNRTIGTYDAAFSASISDAFSLTLQTRKQTFDNLLSLAEGISVNYNSAEFDVTPDERTRGDVRFSRGIYSDGNRQNLIELAFDRRVVRTPNVTIGILATHTDFSEMLQNGYFNPASYNGIEAIADATGQIGSRWNYDVAGGLGTETDVPGGSDTAYSVTASLGYRIGSTSTIDLYYDAYNAYRQASSGFGLHAGGIRLSQRL